MRILLSLCLTCNFCVNGDTFESKKGALLAITRHKGLQQAYTRDVLEYLVTLIITHLIFPRNFQETFVEDRLWIL